MYLIGEQSTLAETLIERLQLIPQRIVQDLAPAGTEIELDACENLAAKLEDSNTYLLKEGSIQMVIDQRPLFFLQAGDLLGLRHGLDLTGWHYQNDDPVTLLAYDRRELLRHIGASDKRQEQYNFYLLGQSTLMIDALSRLKQPEVKPITGYQHFAPGEELIHQGEVAEHVFVIIEGHAEAWVDGEKVGDVGKDEIFGAMAVFTHEVRSATVIATEPCTVMVIPKDQFLSLMQHNPRIASSLIESMARRIDMMNKEITVLRKQANDKARQ